MTLFLAAFKFHFCEEMHCANFWPFRVLGQTVHLDGITLFMPAIALALMLIRPFVLASFRQFMGVLDPSFWRFETLDETFGGGLQSRLL
jgi:hypothetical protein